MLTNLKLVFSRVIEDVETDFVTESGIGKELRGSKAKFGIRFLSNFELIMELQSFFNFN
jgi:hypothetical protein